MNMGWEVGWFEMCVTSRDHVQESKLTDCSVRNEAEKGWIGD
jgi:hypothetical protein